MIVDNELISTEGVVVERLQFITDGQHFIFNLRRAALELRQRSTGKRNRGKDS